MERFSIDFDRQIARSDDALRFLKELDDADAPREILSNIIQRAFRISAIQAHYDPESFTPATSEIYIG